MRCSFRVLAAAAAIAAVLLGSAPGPAAADSQSLAGPVVLLATAGLSWDDVTDATPALAALRASGSSGWLAVRSVRPVTCPTDGWLAVSAGRRSADVAVGVTVGTSEPGCRSLTSGATEGGGPSSVPLWSQYQAQARSDSFDAAPGLLGSSLTAAGVTTAAVGPGAAIALADPQGQVAHAWPGAVDGASGVVAPSVLTEDVESALATDPHLLVVDLGAIRDPARMPSGEPALTGGYARPRAEQVKALDTRLGLVLAELPANATVIVASIADSGTPSQLQLLAARGPAPLGGAFVTSLIGSTSTRQDGLAQTTDLPPTLLTALSVPVPDQMVGASLKPVDAGRSTAQRQRALSDRADPVAVTSAIVPWLFNSLVVAQLLLYAATILVLRRRAGPGGSGPGGQGPRARGAGARGAGARGLGRVRVAALVLAGFPVATFLANLLPWWRAGSPHLALAGAVLLFTLGLTTLALVGPVRRVLLGPAALIGAVTAGVLTIDALAGSHLVLSSLMGVSPVVAGRFYGFSNPVFAFFAAGTLLVTITVADTLVRRGYRGAAVLVVAGVGLLATAIDGSPGIGADFGGPPAIIPGFTVLALLVAGVRVTWRRALLIAGVTVGVLLALALLDWLRAPGDRTHLGRFVQSVIDGDAGPVVRRKAAQNLKILFTSYLSALLPVALAFVLLVLDRPAPAGGATGRETGGLRPLRVAYQQAPVLRLGLIAFCVMMVIAAALNDSGTAVPAYATMLVVPLLVVTCVRALELDGESGPGGPPSSNGSSSSPGEGQ